MKSLFLITISVLNFACYSSKTSVPSDFSVSYSMANYLVKYELNIKIAGIEMSLSYRNEQNNTSGSGVYTIKENEAYKIYKYLDSINFLAIGPIPGDKLLDAPQQNITATYDNKSNSIDFGTVKNPPDNILKAKSIIIELASKYNLSFKKDMGFE